MHTRLNRIFNGLKVRCYNPKNKDYPLYGGRGIKLCDEWNDRETAKNEPRRCTKGFISFKKWALENGYSDELTLDRIDTDGDYEPSNCRWVSMQTQNNNRRNNHYITYQNKTQSLAEWCRELNLNYYKIRGRINNYNWSPERAFTTE